MRPVWGAAMQADARLAEAWWSDELAKGDGETVREAYEQALRNVPARPWERASIREQLEILRDLAHALGRESIARTLDAISAGLRSDRRPPPESPLPPAARRVIVFGGHRLDESGRASPRLPASAVPAAEGDIAARLAQEDLAPGPEDVAIGSLASGADLLIAEALHKRGVAMHVVLPMEAHDFIRTSVAPGGDEWVRRFHAAIEKAAVHQAPPRGQTKPEEAFSRANAWMVDGADAVRAQEKILFAVWDRQASDGPGGTEDLVQRAEQAHLRTIVLDPTAWRKATGR